MSYEAVIPNHTTLLKIKDDINETSSNVHKEKWKSTDSFKIKIKKCIHSFRKDKYQNQQQYSCQKHRVQIEREIDKYKSNIKINMVEKSSPAKLKINCKGETRWAEINANYQRMPFAQLSR